MTDTDHPTPATTVALDIGGMTCASCAARITKRLNKLDGVDAIVNYATEQATVTLPDGLTVDDVVAEVEAIGYTADAARGRAPTPDDGDERADDATDPELTRAAQPADRRRRARHPGPADLDDQHAAVRQLAVAHLHPGRRRSCCGRRGRSTGPRG